MARHIVVAFRMPPAGIAPGPEGSYITRARSLFSRGEALGGQLVAWSAALLAVGWDTDSMEEAVHLSTSIREEARKKPERAWAAGLAEGELDPLAPDGARMHLAWGPALLMAASLARIARAGEVLVDGDVRALRAGQLGLLGARAATDAGQRVRGWKLDLDHPWKRNVAGVPPAVPPPLPAAARSRVASTSDVEATLETPAMDFAEDELSSAEVLQIVEATISPLVAETTAEPPASEERTGTRIAERVRKLARGDQDADAIEALAELRRARAAAEGGPPAARCQAALALAMTLAIAGRPEEALLEALDALARAREAKDAKAVGACMALLAKLYSRVGRGGEATALREAAGVS
ncbi:MAG TPA: hypothetical protein VMI75_20425 [Polyangiaceae bacterium]|nr:hypothetical protein [Polyangiaceae bacterium]